MDTAAVDSVTDWCRHALHGGGIHRHCEDVLSQSVVGTRWNSSWTDSEAHGTDREGPEGCYDVVIAFF